MAMFRIARMTSTWLGLVSALFICFGSGGTTAQDASDKTWNSVLEAARKEGVVVVSGPPGAFQRDAIVTSWAKAYPEIELQYTGGRGSAVISKIVRERTAKLYNWDIILASTNSVVSNLVPINALAPLRDALIRPELSDDKTWIDGFENGFMDRERKFLYSPMGLGAQPLGYVNRDCLSKDVFGRTADMKKSELKGKIVWFDPTRSGVGSRNTWVLSLLLGEDWLKDLFQNHRVTFSRDYRQMTDWLVNCSRPVAFGMPDDVVEQMQKAGIGKNVEEMIGEAYYGDLNPGGPGGNESIAWYNNAPHPNAAKVFVNWYLSRDFQNYYASRVRDNSRRVDTTPGDSEHVMKAGVQYLIWSNEEATDKVTALQKKIETWGLK
jgi:iron(III) transport system substrate-binding protein